MSAHSAYSYKVAFDTAREVFRRAQQAKEVRVFITYAAGEEDKWEREFYEIFYTVRSTLNQLLARIEHPQNYRPWALKALSAGTITTTDGGALTPVDIAHLGGPLTEQIHIKNGCLKFNSPLLLHGFRRAFTDVKLERLRRCPVCTGFYYALRANKGACDEHLGLERVLKNRQKTPEYRERWRNKRLVKQGRMMEPFIDESRPSEMAPNKGGD
jgi:hypothetical protein